VRAWHGASPRETTSRDTTNAARGAKAKNKDNDTLSQQHTKEKEDKENKTTITTSNINNLITL